MVGGFANLGPTYMKVKKAQRNATDAALASIKDIGDEWAALVGRSFDHVECFGMEDAERAIVVLGSAAGNARAVARRLRDAGEKVGVVKLRTYRPFPLIELGKALQGVRALAVLDRAETFSAPAGPLALDVMTALYAMGVSVPLRSYIYGLGGADVKLEYMTQVFDDLKKVATGEEGDVREGLCLNDSPRFLGIA